MFAALWLALSGLCVCVQPTDAADDEGELQMEMLFAHTPRYPDEPPSVRLRSIKGLSDDDLAAGMRALQTHVEENMGMAMIYQLFTAAQEWLAERQQAAPSSDPEADRRRAEVCGTGCVVMCQWQPKHLRHA